MKKMIIGVIASLMMMPACTTEPENNEPEEVYNRELTYSYTKAEDGINMEVFLPTEEKNIKVAVIACPGGSYSSHAEHEGAVWAPYFNDLGIAFAVLKYTLPNGNPNKPIADMEAALKLFHDMADKWLIDKSKIGVMGFSAGGHLACYSATASDFDSDIRPDFQVLIYPVTTMSSGTHAGSRDNFLGAGSSNEDQMFYSNELWVSSYTPKAFISYAKSETVVPPSSNGQAFYNAMIKAGAQAECLPIEGDRHGWHHSKSEHVNQYLTPLKEKLTPWLLGL